MHGARRLRPIRPPYPTVELTVVQLQHASTINAVGLSRGISEQGRIIAVATAYQESSLRNRPNGDRDSVGLFQQRPSQGWGTAEQIIDPVYSSGKFYDALLEVPGWQDMSLTEAAQAVQYSAFPDAYAKWEPQATTLVRGLSGTTAPELTCSSGSRMPTSEAPQRPPLAGTDAATPELTATLAAAQAELGGLTVDKVSDDGMTATVDVTVPELDPTAAGRSLAAWARRARDRHGRDGGCRPGPALGRPRVGPGRPDRRSRPGRDHRRAVGRSPNE